MFHDFEEIIFFKAWLSRNKDLLKSKFPRLAETVLPHMERLSTAAFSLAVAEEFILVTLLTYASVWQESYFLWFAIFAAFSLHLVGHVVQWLVFGKYVPSIVTSLLCLPYCAYTLDEFLSTGAMRTGQVIGWTVAGLVIMILNLLLAHKLALVFEKWQSAQS